LWFQKKAFFLLDSNAMEARSQSPESTQVQWSDPREEEERRKLHKKLSLGTQALNDKEDQKEMRDVEEESVGQVRKPFSQD